MTDKKAEARIQRTFRIPKNIDAKFTKYAADQGMNLTETFIFLLKSALGEHTNAYVFLDDACPALVYLNKGFYCAIKAPNIKMLGDGSAEDSAKVCKACQQLKGIISQADLAAQLSKSNYQVDIPYCAKGGKLDPNLKKIYCPTIGNWKKITQCSGEQGRRFDFYRVIKADARLAASEKR